MKGEKTTVSRLRPKINKTKKSAITTKMAHLFKNVA